jgi:hypothetical protein
LNQPIYCFIECRSQQPERVMPGIEPRRYLMAELRNPNRTRARINESTVAIGGDYLTEDQAAALGRFLANLHRRELRREQNKARSGTTTETR